MAKIAIIDKSPGHIDYVKYMKLEDFASDISIFHLCSQRVKKVLKKDVDLDIDIDQYKFVILVGSEAAKHYAKVTSVTNYAGQLVHDKFIPMINPAMLSFKPEAEKGFYQACDRIKGYLKGERLKPNQGDFVATEDPEHAMRLLLTALKCDSPVIAMDSETSDFDPRKGYLLGISLTWKLDQGVYISADCLLDEHIDVLQQIFDTKDVVFHNAKFDLKWFEIHLGIKTTKPIEDTMLMHYVLDETQGSHGLKILAMRYTRYGDYERELDEFKAAYCKSHKVKKDEFSYAFIPFDIISPYACIDTAVTFELYHKFKAVIDKSDKFTYVYEQLLRRGMMFLKEIEENGVPFCKDRILLGRTQMEVQIQELKEHLYQFKEVHKFEEEEKITFNPNSPVQLRKLLFTYVGLKPTGRKTGTGADSTDAEVLTQLAKEHPIPRLILNIRKKGKIKNTYLDKIVIAIDSDGRLRTYFNLTTTTSGRLSSSGKLNMQQLPRDDKLVKGCIRAPKGYKIVSQDLGTAEMYYAAVLSGDKNLMKVFQSGSDFHSTVAHMVFGLTCKISEVKDLYPGLRQAAKAISFGILYGSGPNKVADTVTDHNRELALEQGLDRYETFTTSDAQEAISNYFKTYPQLKRWLSDCKGFITMNGFIFSALGRKRRLKNVMSDDKGIAAGEVRSGINFLIQSVASDINLIAAMDMQDHIKSSSLDAQIFGLVHDSILAVVKEEDVEEYCNVLAEITQKDRGLSIPGSPIKIDQEIGDDYSFGGFEKQYPELVDRQAA